MAEKTHKSKRMTFKNQAKIQFVSADPDKVNISSLVYQLTVSNLGCSNSPAIGRKWWRSLSCFHMEEMRPLLTSYFYTIDFPPFIDHWEQKNHHATLPIAISPPPATVQYLHCTLCSNSWFFLRCRFCTTRNAEKVELSSWKTWGFYAGDGDVVWHVAAWCPTFPTFVCVFSDTTSWRYYLCLAFSC